MVLHMEEEEMPPKVTIQPGSIDLGGVGYLRSATKVLEVKNTGKVREIEAHVLQIRFDDAGGTLDTLCVLVRAVGGGGASVCVYFWL